MLIQQWMRQCRTPRKKTPKSLQKKPISQNKWEVVDLLLPSSSAPYPMGTQIFLLGSGKGEEESGAQVNSGDLGESRDIHSPSSMVGKYCAKFNTQLAVAGLPPLGTPSNYYPMFPDSPACPYALDFTPGQDNWNDLEGPAARTYVEVLAAPPVHMHTGPSVSRSCPLVNLYAKMKKHIAKFDKDSNEVHFFLAGQRGSIGQV
jgi:hypothetical protein